MTIKSRTTAAKKQAQTSRLIKSRNAHRKTFTCISITDRETTYQTTLECLKVKEVYEDISWQVITCECIKIVALIEDCKGNSKTICRHTMAHLIKANQDKIITFFDDFSEAFNYSNFGGTLSKVQSVQGKQAHGWMVIKNKAEKKLVDTPMKYHADPSYTDSDLVNEDDYPSPDKDFEKAEMTSASFKTHVSLMREPIEEGIK